VLDERNRIAREMHDVVAHSVSLMVVQAGAARACWTPSRGLPGGAAVRRGGGAEALAELRRVLGLLRGTSEPVGLRPQPGTGPAGLARRGDQRLRAWPSELHGRRAAAAAAAPVSTWRSTASSRRRSPTPVKHARASRAQVRLVWAAGRAGRGGPRRRQRPARADPGRARAVGMRERLTAYGGGSTPDRPRAAASRARQHPGSRKAAAVTLRVGAGRRPGRWSGPGSG
jgi:hypothetical protein